MTVKLMPVTRDDVKPLFQIKVKPDQKEFIAANEFSLAQVHYETGATPYVIWSDEIRVGLMLVIDMRECQSKDSEDDPHALYVWRLLIGQEHQGKGYGTAAMAALLELAGELGLATVETSTLENNHPALRFYDKLGYVRTGNVIDSEVQLRKELNSG